MGRITETLIRRIPLVVAAGLIAAASAQDNVFRANVTMVRLLVSVKDKEGVPALELKKESFKIYDNGIEQQVAVFEEHTSQPLSVAILIDNSGSTGIDLKYETDSVIRFGKALFGEGNPDDRAMLYSFNWEVVARTGYTHSAQEIDRRLRGLKGEGGTSLYDALVFAARRLEDREGRHVIIVITDGGDTTSSHTFLQAIEAVQMADAVIYSILVMPITNDAGRNIGGENALTAFAEGTGGRVFAPSLGPQLDEVFAKILRELRTQYLVGYYPKNVPRSKERFHKVRVTVDQPGLRVQTRSGYYGEFEH